MVVRTPPLGAQDRSSAGQRAAHHVDGQRHRAALSNAVPGVLEPDDLVAVESLALADDGAQHGIQPGAVTATGEDSDAHEVDGRAFHR